jgi:hypothetical protein
MDSDQSCFPDSHIKMMIQGSTQEFSILSFQGQPKDEMRLNIFNQAISMVQKLFADKRIEMDLQQGILKNE